MTRAFLLLAVALFTASADAQDGGRTWATAVSSRPSDDRKIVYRYVQEYLPSFDRARYSTRITLSWRYESPSGMPSTSERESMDRFEDLLEPQLEPTLLASLALVRTGDNLRQWTYYTKSESGFRAKLEQAIRSAGGAPVEASAVSDPAWRVYEQFVKGVRR